MARLTVVDLGNGRVAVEWSYYGSDMDVFSPSICQECNVRFEDMPAGFLRYEGGDAWLETSEGTLEAGKLYYGCCGPCAQLLADLDHQEYVNGNWDRRTLEDERYIWER